jgi:monoamine oxidase
MRVAIIGGGPSGLMTANLLQQYRPEAQVTLFEASNRLGGKLITTKFNALPAAYEAGTAELYDYSMTGEDPLRELVRELGLTTRPLHSKTVVIRGNLLQSDTDIRYRLGQPALDALEAFRCRARSLISAEDYYESDWKLHNKSPLARQTFQELLASVPNEQAREYIRVSAHSDLATEPHQTNAIYGLHNFLMNEPSYMSLYTIEGGLEQLTQRLAARLDAQVRLSHRVTSVEKTAQRTYRVDSEVFDSVIVALPNNWIPEIEWRGAELSAAMHAHHAYYDYPAHYLRITMLFHSPFWRNQIDESYFMLDDFGGCCVYDQSPSSGPGVLGWLLAGEAAMNWSNFDDQTIIARVLESLPESLGYRPGMLIEGQVHRWIASVNGLPAGNPQKDPVARHVPEPSENPRLLVVGDYLFDSTLNGALDSADTAVDLLLQEIPELVTA